MRKNMENKIPIIYITQNMLNAVKRGHTITTKIYYVAKGDKRGDGSGHANVRVKLTK